MKKCRREGKEGWKKREKNIHLKQYRSVAQRAADDSYDSSCQRTVRKIKTKEGERQAQFF